MSSPFDAAWFEALFADCYPRVLRYALRRTDAHSAHDIAAEVLLLAWRRQSEIPDDPLPWLLTSARLILANKHRSDARQLRTINRLGRERPDPATDQPGASYDETAWWRWALEQLPARDREILTLLAWDELTHAEAATVLGCRPSTFAMRLTRARRRLVKILATNAPHLITTRTPSRSSQEHS